MVRLRAGLGHLYLLAALAALFAERPLVDDAAKSCFARRAMILAATEFQYCGELVVGRAEGQGRVGWLSIRCLPYAHSQTYSNLTQAAFLDELCTQAATNLTPSSPSYTVG